MFTERLNAIMAALGLKSLTLAKEIGCDRSNIDRICKGTRVPRRNGKSALRIAQALYTCADDAGKTDVLLKTVPCEDASSADAIRAAVLQWLFADEPEDSSPGTPAENKNGLSVFGQRLNAVMELTGLSNARLGRLMHVDPSYVSRFRNGRRSPAANPRMADKLCEILLRQADACGRLQPLAALTHIPESALTAQSAARAFHGWLFDIAPEDPSPLIAGMLDQIGSITETKKTPLSFEAAAPADVLADTAPVYHGQAGLRRAVLRFLGSAAANKPEKLFLYSDQNMDWMVADPFFRAQWATLMSLVVTGGTEICIIHNIDRDLTEMAAAIRSWLPLYPSGRIRSYYSRIPNRGRFSHTLFLCPGLACVSGANVRETEDGFGLYRYDTAPAILAAQEKAFRAMLENAGELAHVEQAADSGGFCEPDETGLTVLGDTLSLATMPEETLLSALSRAGADRKTRTRLLSLCREGASALARTAQSGFLHEFISLPPKEALINGSVPMDLPGLSVFYTREEFSAHIKNVLALSEAFPQYRFFPLPEPVFPEMRVLIAEHTAFVARRSPPAVVIRFSHPTLCRAFADFSDRVRSQYKQDRLTVKNKLETCL